MNEIELKQKLQALEKELSQLRQFDERLSAERDEDWVDRPPVP